MGKVYTRLQTKTAQKPHPRGAAHTCIAYIREFPPPGGRVLSARLEGLRPEES